MEWMALLLDNENVNKEQNCTKVEEKDKDYDEGEKKLQPPGVRAYIALLNALAKLLLILLVKIVLKFVE
eukprot:1728260-Ditylum_brightwellii.AAC.1